jgi:hypothetical protein
MNVVTPTCVLLGIIMFVSLFVPGWFNSRADRRAHGLLRAVLTQEQYQHLIQRAYIDIPSPSVPHENALFEYSFCGCQISRPNT